MKSRNGARSNDGINGLLGILVITTIAITIIVAERWTTTNDRLKPTCAECIKDGQDSFKLARPFRPVWVD